MSREAPVRIREGLGVKLPRATRLILGFDGPKEEAEAIKAQLGRFLSEQLKLELSPEKTLVTHAKTETARFLGYEISTLKRPGLPSHGNIALKIPYQVIKDKIARYTLRGRPIHRAEMIEESDLAIVDRYGREFQGYVEFYSHARNLTKLQHVRWVMQNSMLKTLARKHKSTVLRMANRYADTTMTKDGPIKCFTATVKSEDKPPLRAQFGGLSLKTRPYAIIKDHTLNSDRRPPGCELILRLAKDECELCGSRDRVQVHHIRKLADLKRNSGKEPSSWKRQMASLKRKTLVVCHYCHIAIHAGKPTRKRQMQEAIQ